MHQSVPIEATTEVGGKRVNLRLLRLAAIVKPGQVGREAIFQFKQYHQGIVHDLTLSLILNLPSVPDAYVVPSSALYQQNTVYVVVNNRLQARDVHIKGRFYVKQQATGLVVTSSTLRNGDFIVTSAIPNAITGLLVKPNVGDGHD